MPKLKNSETVAIWSAVSAARGNSIIVPNLYSTAEPTSDVISFAGNPIIGKGAHIHETTWQRMAWAAGVAEVEVDTATGSVKVLNYVAAHDVGRAINPMGVKQQIEGGAIMGIGQALTETLMRDTATGQIRTVAPPMSLNAYKVDIAQNLIERTLLQALG